KDLKPFLKKKEKVAKKKKKKKRKKSPVLFEFEEDHIVTLENQFLISGIITPNSAFEFNGTKVTPKEDGEFQVTAQLTKGLNVLNFKAKKSMHQKKIWSLSTFNDMSGHWFEKKSAVLRYLGFVQDTPNFKPKEYITRVEFAKTIGPLYGLLPESSKQSKILDIKENESHYMPIKAVVDSNLVQLLDGGYFKPNKIMTKYEVVKALVALNAYPKLEKTELNAIKLPFKDVRRRIRFKEVVKHAYHYELVSSSSWFYPYKKVTRAELYTLLYRSPFVQEKIKKVFEYDQI
ncbi:hypothetical protein DID77_01875, partial [Candidatus Marinamargulisbacteria bacterium SCGC AG-439-L15]